MGEIGSVVKMSGMRPDIHKEFDVPFFITVSEHLVAHGVRCLKYTVACVEFLSANLKGRAEGDG
jgi:hypothetical protein